MATEARELVVRGLGQTATLDAALRRIAALEHDLSLVRAKVALSDRVIDATLETLDERITNLWAFAESLESDLSDLSDAGICVERRRR
jgi:hypothetical protein